ncbi:hypothetical protein [Enterobacter cloacae]|uniref:hypothetical protein n=6 Tax=Enterobacter TaxID=547 RepID=UPI0006986FF1|nr:hypothetical protein [Enterobacter cloacae]EKV7706955.1 hypothetical protein [Enterobacter cloacae]KTH19540.1 hypothetical protein ASV28_21085 [Enterobacter cloacae subsp. cloacae]KTH19894.1 hypothetical protein ASV29_03975 [Enterobacter cloacae subsp. cloacae]PCM70168.1 hypothetical protein CP904_19840 [Enterobacter cloacae]PDQ12857.1 hypothetical protein CKK21_23175 [Enterobacter cloacae]
MMMSGQETPAAEHSLNKVDKNVKVVLHKSCQCYFRIETLELIFIDESDAAEFEKCMSKLSELIDKHHKANADYSDAVEKYGNAMKDIANKNKLSGYEDAITSTEIALEKATKDLQAELGEFNEQSGYKPLIELIPIQPLNKGIYGRCYSYVKHSDYDSFESKFTIISVDTFSGDAIFKKDDKGNIIGINISSLKTKLASVKNTIKQMMDSTMTVSADINYEATLTDWANAWNEQCEEYSKEGNYIDVSAGAQFLRFTANASTLNTWNPDTGEARIKGETCAELMLFTGKVNSTIYTPDRVGWPLRFTVNDTDEVNLGVLRARIDCELTGYVGASAQVEGNLQFVTYNNKQLLMGNRTPGSRFAERKKGVKIKDNKEKPHSLEIKGEAFGGAKAGGSLGGALQWLKPFDSLVDELPNMLRTFGLVDSPAQARIILAVQQSEKEKDAHLGGFQDFASLKVGGNAELGVGLSGEFRVRFVKGRFRFHIKGGLCLAVGAEGDVEGEISPELFGEFAIWVIYQLYGIDYKHLTIITEEAFMGLTYMLVMGGKEIYKKYYDELAAEIGSVKQDLIDFIDEMSNEFLAAKNQSTERNELSEIINADPGSVYLFSPEAKGIALFVLTGDGAYDHIDINNQGDGFLPDTNNKRKTAVLYILSSIQTKREWKKVLTRITKDGTVFPGNEDAIVDLAQKNLKIFLQIGFNRDKELEDIIDRLNLRDFEEVVKRLKSNPAWGYAFSPNCSKQYALHCDDNPFYTSLCYFEPVNPQYKQKWEGNK